ncbi:hypothetical protein [Paraburkholderia sp. BL10I2N1]|nr:hypothetical protein [Paraburkholderia sp. BL10I2N1]
MIPDEQRADSAAWNVSLGLREAPGQRDAMLALFRKNRPAVLAEKG